MRIPDSYIPGQTLGQYIKAERSRRLFSAVDFAKRLDIGTRQLRFIESDTRIPGRETLAHIAFVLTHFNAPDEEAEWSVMYWHLIGLADRLSPAEAAMLQIEVLLKTKLKKKEKLRAIKAEVDVALNEDYGCWESNYDGEE